MVFSHFAVLYRADVWDISRFELRTLVPYSVLLLFSCTALECLYFNVQCAPR